MESLAQDIRYAFRALRRAPGLSAVAALSLALGVSANATIFSGVDVFEIRPLPFDPEGRLVQVWTTQPARGRSSLPLSLPDYLDVRSETQALDIAAYATGAVNLSEGEEAERLSATRASWNLFRIMDVRPALGRAFLPEEEAAGADRVVVLSHVLWQRFGGDPRILGRRLTLDGEAHTVVGVLPARFKFPAEPADVWLPLEQRPAPDRGERFLLAIGRLRPAATLEQAQAELAAIGRRLETAYPASNAGYGARVLSLHAQLTGRDDPAESYQEVILLLLAAGFVLLIACANVANLLLARGAARQRELALRAAVGASRWRVVRQLLTESVVLALLGGALGVLVTVWATDALASMLTFWWPLQLRADELGVDGRVLSYSILLCVVAAALFGIAPALEATRPDLIRPLHEGSRGATAGRRRGRLRSALVVSEISLALLVTSGLLMKAFLRIQRADLGFDSRNVLTLRVTLPEKRYPDGPLATAFYRDALERIRPLPGVDAAAAITALPNPYNATTTRYSVEGEAPAAEGQEPVVQFRGITPGFFEAFRIPVVAGRAFTEQDREDSPAVVVISQALARRHWPGGDPIGKKVVFPSGPREIVGVVADTREGLPRGSPVPVAYLPAFQMGYRSLALVVRTVAEPARYTDAVRARIRAVDPTVAPYNIVTLEQFLRDEFAGLSIMPKLVGTLAAAALVLAVIGVYSMVAYAVTQRTPEIGVRVALGARREHVFRLVVGGALRLAFIGAVIGVVLSLPMAWGLGWMLFGLSPLDAATYAGVVVALVAATAAAAYLPARRALRVDPMAALRVE